MRGLKKAALALGVAVAALSVPASANHSWGGYHWARTANPFTVKVGDNVDSRWDSYLATTSTDWNKSAVVKNTVVAGTTNPKNCRGVTGTVQVCNSTYGQTGWLGIASISITGGTHITQATVKLNDTYFNTAKYNTPAWRNMVSCQEVGHAWGLDHQDETFTNTNLGTCMDYTNDPSGRAGTNGTLDNEHPNTHDYDQLATIYSHLDSSTTVASGLPTGSAVAPVGDTPASWGRPVHFLRDGRPDVYVRMDGAGLSTVTHVFWAQGEGPGRE